MFCAFVITILYISRCVTEHIEADHYLEWRDGIPRCLWPCDVREAPQILAEGVYFTGNTPSVGLLFNYSRPIGDQVTPSECITREGPFFLGREFGKFFCLKIIQVSRTEHYAFRGPPGDAPYFCKLCDFTQTYVVGYASGVPVVPDGPPPSIGCNLPSSCPDTTPQHIPCSPSHPKPDDGTRCELWRNNQDKNKHKYRNIPYNGYQ